MESSPSSSGPAGAASGPSSHPTTTPSDSRPPVPEIPSSDPSATSPPEKVKKRPSRVSLLGKRKNNSPTNSKRGDATHAEANEAGAVSAAKEPPSATKPPKRRGGFLAFLNCCGSSQGNEDIDLNERPTPAREASVPQGQQDVPKQDNSNAPSSTADGSKEVPPEKGVTGTPYSDMKPAGAPKIQPPPTEAETAPAPTPEASNPPEAANPPEVSKSADEKPPVVQTIVPSKDLEAQRSPGQSELTAIDSDPAKGDGQSEGETVINDRTEQQEQRDHDVAMPDAPPVEPVVPAAEPPAPAPAPAPAPPPAEPEPEPAKNDPTPPLPPPPPIDQRRTDVVSQGGRGLAHAPGEGPKWLLPPLRPEFQGKKCLVLDLDETLVHSSFKVSLGMGDACVWWWAVRLTGMEQILHQADFTIPVEIEGQYHNVYVIKRPGVDQFMKRVGELYEVVVFTASVSKVCSHHTYACLDADASTQYGDPLLDQLDIHHVVHHRLFRESCYNHQGNYVKVRSHSPSSSIPSLSLLCIETPRGRVG